MTIKKSMFLFILLTFSFSCSNDNPTIVEESTFQEKLIGTWQLTNRSPNGIEYCERSNTLRFSENNEFYIKMFISDDMGGCRSASTYGTWKHLEGNKIEIDFEGVEENSFFKIKFSDNSNTLKLVDDLNEDISTETYTKQ